MPSPAQLTAPAYTPDEAANLALRLYGVRGRVEALPSERDQNFALFTDDGGAFVLKIANSADEAAVLDCQNQAMMRLADHAVSAPRVTQTLDGRMMAHAGGQGAARHCVRLVSYLPGKPLAVVRPHSTELLREIGQILGRLDDALRDFDHPALDRALDWDLRRGADIVSAYASLLPQEKRLAAERCLSRFNAHVTPRLGSLRTGPIHGDGNDYNILVEVTDWRYRPSGVIDFGDMTRSWIAAEPAIAAAYAMLGKANPLQAAAAVVGGYHAAYPLTEQEVDALFDLITLRLCTSMVMAARQQQAAPDNAYLGISQEPVWALLQQIEAIPHALAACTLRQACGMTAAPGGSRVAAWLAAQQPSLHPVVQDSLRTPETLVLDLSVGSPLLPAHPAALGPKGLQQIVTQQMATQGVHTAVGRYDEARWVVAAMQVADEGEEHPEATTISLGMEIMQPVGAPIFAPLAGVVHHISNSNDAEDAPFLVLIHTTDDGTRFFTRYGGLRRASLDGLTPGQCVAAGGQLGEIDACPPDDAPHRLPPHLHLQIMLDMDGEELHAPQRTSPSRRAAWTALCPDPNLLLGVPASAFPDTGRDAATILATRRQCLGRNLSISYRRPVKIVRGWRQFLYDDAGRAYLDGVNNVSHVGHSHPHVVQAIQRQAAVLNTNTRYLHDSLIEYAERLLAHFPDPLNVVFFVCSGSEANELALRLARTYTGRQDVIMLDAAYHGNTQATVDISPYKHAGPGGQGAPAWAHAAPLPDPYRGRYKGYGAATGQRYAEHVRQLLEQTESRGRHVAAFIAESVPGCGGQIVLPAGYLRAAYGHVRAAGSVCIADEVQVGFGRAGSHFWGFETQAAVPDIVTLGKPMGNGHPLGAVVTTPAIADAFANGMEYFNTFGGNPVSCAAGLAVLDVIDQEGLQAHAAAVGAALLADLRMLQARHALIGDVRGLGLFIGVELVLDRTTLAPAPEHASYIANRLRDHGIFISTDGPLHNVLKLKPPLPFDRQDAARVVETLDHVLREDCLQIG